MIFILPGFVALKLVMLKHGRGAMLTSEGEGHSRLSEPTFADVGGPTPSWKYALDLVPGVLVIIFGVVLLVETIAANLVSH